MIPIAWKEIRENAKWAVLGLIGVSIAMALTLTSENQQYAFQGPEGLISTQFLMITTFGSAIVGALLGLLQIIPESLRDQWSFLLHRPTTRSRLFWGKVIGGLMLYIAALGLPLLGAFMWVSRPGHLAAPFDWRMVLPGVADVLAGVIFYFAGLLVALRSARWYATRALPIAASGATVVLVAAVPEFWHALLVIIIAWAVLGTAAWSTFNAGGEFQPQSRPAKIVLGIILLVGLFVAGGLLVGMLEAMTSSRIMDHSHYFLDRKGRSLIAHIVAGQTTVTDLQGRDVEEFKDPKITAQLYNHQLDTSFLLFEREMHNGYRHSNRFRNIMNAGQQESWYFVRADRRFEGFRFYDYSPIGWIGMNGYSLDREKTEPFADVLLSEGYWGTSETLLPCAQGIFRIDWMARTLSMLYQPAAKESILGACDVNAQSEEQKTKLVAVAIATSSRIVLIDAEGASLASLPYHYDTSQYGLIRISAAWPGDRLFIWYSAYSRLSSQAMKLPEYVVEITPSGQERSRVTLPPLPRPQVPSRWYERLLPGLAPLAFYIVMAIIILVGMWRGYDDVSWVNLREQIQHDPTDAAIAIVMFIVLTVATAVITLRIMRRYAFSPAGRRFWTAAAVFVGSAALLTLLGLHQWPALVPCPNCNKRRRVDHEHCPHCGQPFPPQEVLPGDIYDAESPQGSNEPAHPATLVPSA